jgi:hypothetical protein
VLSTDAVAAFRHQPGQRPDHGAAQCFHQRSTGRATLETRDLAAMSTARLSRLNTLQLSLLDTNRSIV